MHHKSERPHRKLILFCTIPFQGIKDIDFPISDCRYPYMELISSFIRRIMMSTDYSYPRRRHLFGWIFLGLIGALIVGGLVLWGIGLATGTAPFYFVRPFGFFFFFPLGFLFFLLLVFFVLRLAFWGSWWGWRGRGYYWGDAKEILRMRYARGEITKEQFDQMMHDLEEHK